MTPLTTNTDDDDFLNGRNQWDETRYQEKTGTHCQGHLRSRSGEDPVLVGLCEVEMPQCCTTWLTRTKMENCGYSYLHKDSPDHRGIDVALLYQPNQIKKYSAGFSAITCSWTETATPATYSMPSANWKRDRLHLLVNPGPSMRGGRAESENKRDAAAEVAWHKIDEIKKTDPQAPIVLMGDFNSYPTRTA